MRTRGNLSRHGRTLQHVPAIKLVLCALLMPATPCAHSRTPDTLPIEHHQENPRIKAKPCDQIDYDSSHQVLDKTRDAMQEVVCRAALWMDSIGTDEDGDVLAARRSSGRIEMSYYWSQFAGGEFRIRAKVRAELPVLKRRLSAFIGLDDEDDFVQDRSEVFALRSEFPSLDDNDDWLAGLGYRFPGSSRVFRSDFRIGAKRLTDTRIFVQNRFFFLAYSDDNDVWGLRETFFWTNQDGFGSTTGSDWMHILSPKLLFRWDTVATVTQETDGVSWRSSAWLYRNVQPQGAGIAIETFTRGATQASVRISEYGLRILYRYPLFGQRMFVELVNGYSWPRADLMHEREGSYGVGLNLQLPFGPQTRY